MIQGEGVTSFPRFVLIKIPSLNKYSYPHTHWRVPPRSATMSAVTPEVIMSLQNQILTHRYPHQEHGIRKLLAALHTEGLSPSEEADFCEHVDERFLEEIG